MTMMVPGRYGYPPTPPQPPPLLGPASARYGEPGWTVWSPRIWPLDPLASASHRLVRLAVFAGVLGTALWRPSVLGVGYFLVGVVVFGVIYGTAERRATRAEWFGLGLTLALLAVPGLLAAQWLGVLCIMAAWIVGWGTLIGGRTWTAVLTGPFVAWCAPARVAGWVRRAGVASRWGRTVPSARGVAVVAVTVVLALVFGGLFAAADPAFARVLDDVVPEFDLFDVAARVVVLGLVLGFVLLGGYLIRFAPSLDDMAPRPMRALPSWEWALPLSVLDVLFVAFVAVQATVLFGGDAHVLETEGLTYAEYARQGFWQLLWVSALTLLVLGAVIRVAGRTSTSERRLLRILVGILCATSVVVVISAIHRMWLYQQAYGFSIQRVMVITIELWLGAVFILIALAGVRMTARWLPRAVLAAGAVALLGLAAMNPERLIADRNVDRYEQTGSLDAGYLLRLSPDVQPALQRLPESIRQCARYRDDDPDAWYEFNLSRSRANHEGTPASVECEMFWSSAG